MSYPETLEVLARLHVDACFRQACLQNAQAAMAPYALTPREREGLAGTAPLVVERAPELLNREETIAFCRYLEAAPRGTRTWRTWPAASGCASGSRGAWSPCPGRATSSPSSIR